VSYVSHALLRKCVEKKSSKIAPHDLILNRKEKKLWILQVSATLVHGFGPCFGKKSCEELMHFPWRKTCASYISKEIISWCWDPGGRHLLFLCCQFWKDLSKTCLGSVLQQKHC